MIHRDPVPEAQEKELQGITDSEYLQYPPSLAWRVPAVALDTPVFAALPPNPSEAKSAAVNFPLSVPHLLPASLLAPVQKLEQELLPRFLPLLLMIS